MGTSAMGTKKALVTGGGGAIAEELARRLDARGYELVLADIDADRMATVAARLSRPATLIEADLSSSAGIASLADRITAELADLDLLVNNAGLVVPGDVVDLSAEEIERHVVVNLLAAMQVSRAAATVMRPRGRGDIVSLISMGGIIALRGSASYSATKFGLRGFHTSLQQELAPHGVRVMGVFPSGVDTPMLRAEAQHPAGSPLNFVGTVLTTAQIADACLRALDSGRLETYVPYTDSLSTRLVAAFPGVIRRVEPLVARIGEKGRRRYLRDCGLDAPPD